MVVHDYFTKELHYLTSVTTIVARNGLIQYLKFSCNGYETNSHSRYAVVVYAMESWQHSSTSLNMSLNDRAVTLLYLLQDFVQPEDTELRGSLWDYAILLGYDLITSKKLVDCAELLRIFLCTTQSPRALLDQPVQSSMRRIGIIDGMGLVRSIQNDKSPEVRSLGVELERVFRRFTFSECCASICSCSLKIAHGREMASNTRGRWIEMSGSTNINACIACTCYVHDDGSKQLRYQFLKPPNLAVTTPIQRILLHCDPGST